MATADEKIKKSLAQYHAINSMPEKQAKDSLEQEIIIPAAHAKHISAARIPVSDTSGAADDIGEAAFDGNCPELTTTWCSYAESIMCLNSYGNGITVSLHPGDYGEKAAGGQSARKYLPNQFHLRFKDTRDYQLADGKYFLYRKDVRAELEHHLSNLNQRGLLNSAVVYFGTVSDPFAMFHKKFDVTTACLEALGQYRPGKLVLQTRSPMVIAALPTFKYLGEQAVAVIPVETHLERSVARYTPGLPRISERLVAAQGLRRQGVAVNIAVSPILPYGDSYRDAWDFAELLNRHADYITFGCLADGSEANEKQLKNLAIAQRMSGDQQFRWLRPHAYRHVYQALMAIAPEKLLLPVKAPIKPSQLALFAA